MPLLSSTPLSRASTRRSAVTCDLQPEADFQHTVAGARALEADLVVLVDRQIDLRDGDVLLRVEVGDEFLVGEHALADDHALALVQPPSARAKRPAVDDDLRGAQVLDEDQVVVTVNEQPVVGRQVPEEHVGAPCPNRTSGIPAASPLLEHAGIAVSEELSW